MANIITDNNVRITRTLLDREDYSIFEVHGKNRSCFIPLNNTKTLYEIELGNTKLSVVLKGEMANKMILDSIKNEVDILLKALTDLTK